MSFHRKNSKNKESFLQEKILQDLRSLGQHCECFKIEKTSDNGIPDIFFTTKITGPVLIETKKSNGILSALQVLKIDKLRKCGTKAFPCYTWAQWVELKSLMMLKTLF